MRRLPGITKLAKDAYSTPLIIRHGEPVVLDRAPLGSAEYDEQFIQRLAFDYPQCLPIAEIDRSYEGLVPICKELYTPVGYLDALYITQTGRLVVLEAKLWRNPEARRKVVAQILDYAKELSRWDYEDLQREVSKCLKAKGNVPYELVARAYPDLDEAQFVDEVQQSLRRGRFLLLIIGDGIREGAAAIANFLESVGRLEFTFGLVEVALYSHSEMGLLVQPRVIARTVELQRVVIELPEGATVAEAEARVSAEEASTDREKFYREFWTEFLSTLTLDDASQPIPGSGKSTNIYFPMPPSGATSWVSAYFSQSTKRVGVYLRFTRGNFADRAYETLSEQRQEIDEEIGIDLTWDDPRQTILSRKPVEDVFDPSRRAEIAEFFADKVNLFVNVFRPRLERIVADTE